MVTFTKRELMLIKKIIDHADRLKTASRPHNVIAEIGYTTVPKELGDIKQKLDALPV